MPKLFLTGVSFVAIAAPLAAQTVVDTERTTAIITSELASGAGSDLTVTDKGSIKVTTGDAVTVDSDNDVTNGGKITVTNSNGSNGILVEGPRSANIINTGTITVDETYAPVDADNDGDIDGPFAVGTDRAGIRVEGGLQGKIEHSGTITVEGNNSFGIVAEGPLNGSFRHDGKTMVVGNNSVAVRMDDISGNVRLAGEVRAIGQGAAGVEFLGDIGGALVVQGDIASTGYRNVTAPSDTSKLDADDLLQGGPALAIEGNVAGGIVFAVAPKDTDAANKDEDADGIEDAKEGSAKIVSYGAAPAVVIGSDANDITIGAVAGTGTGFGIIVDGAISGKGVYSGVAANGMVLGGQGGAVTIAGGMLVNGSIDAAAVNATATALKIGSQTTLPELRNAGTISASTTGTGAGSAVAIEIAAGATMPVLRNSGTISAKAGGDNHSASAIIDHSGTLGLVENSGKIIAGGTEDSTISHVALDLSARAQDTVVKQTAVAAGVAAPQIVGDIKFGAGNDLLDIADGSVTGKVTFSDGIDRFNLSRDAAYTGMVLFGGQADVLELADTASFNGTAAFAGGAGSLTLSDKAAFSGRLVGAQNVAVTVDGGFLDLRGATSIASLDVGESGVIVATLGPSATESTAITVGGTASFADGAKLRLRLTDITDAIGSYDVLTAGTLVGGALLESDESLVPFMYQAELAVSGNTISVDIDRKATEDLGLNRSEAAAFDALYDALANDDDVANIFLQVRDGALFQALVAQTLPDHAGGSFEGISQGQRTINGHLIDPRGPYEPEGKLRLVADMGYWGGSKDRGDTATYELSGLGFRGGAEILTGVGAFGATASWMFNETETGFDNSIISNSYDAGLHWRGNFGPVSAFTRASIGRSDFDGHRKFTAGSGDEKVDLTIDRNWSGNFAGISGGVSLEGGSQFFFVRPSVTFDYLRLKEDGYEESGGGDALNLTVEERTSDELGVNLGLAAGVDLFGMKAHDKFWVRLEGEGGWREILGGSLGATRARYGDGETFTLVPEQSDGGWFAKAKIYAGDPWYSIGATVGAEEHYGKTGYNLRASLRFGW